MTTPEVAATAPVQDVSVMDDIIEIFYAPSRVFARRRDNPKFWAAFFILAVLFAIGTWVMMRALAPVLDAQMARQMEATMRKNPGVTADQLETGRKIGAAMAPIFAILAGVISTLILGVMIWLVGKFLDSKADLRQSTMIATFASFPKVIDLILGAVLALGLGTDNIPNMMAATPSLARFTPAGMSLATVGMLSRLSIGIIWATILIAIGLRIVGRMSKGKAWTAAIILWLLGTAIAVVGAVRSGA